MRLLSRVLGCAAAIAAASVVTPASAAEHIKVCTVKTFGGGPTFVAKDKGFFAAQGLNAEVVMFNSAQPIAVAVTSGDCSSAPAA